MEPLSLLLAVIARMSTWIHPAAVMPGCDAWVCLEYPSLLGACPPVCLEYRSLYLSRKGGGRLLVVSSVVYLRLARRRGSVLKCPDPPVDQAERGDKFRVVGLLTNKPS